MVDFYLYFFAQMQRVKTLYAYRRGNWRNLPIKESGEKLVEIPAEMCHPFYCKDMRVWHDERMFVRENVFSQFLFARRKAYSYGFDLMAYDGWRSLELQENLFWHYLKEFTVKKFGMEKTFVDANSPTEIRDIFLSLSQTLQVSMKEANRTYVSWPSGDLLSPSPHATGGSIDVWPHCKGQPVNLGVPFDWMEQNAGSFYHLKIKRDSFAGNDRSICRNRNTLIYCMVSAGFSCYGPEIWHFNLGNQMDSLVSKKIAQYSYIEP